MQGILLRIYANLDAGYNIHLNNIIKRPNKARYNNVQHINKDINFMEELKVVN